MPRKDRRFTAADIRRLACSNLTVEQRRLLDALGTDCGDTTPEGVVLSILSALTEPPLSYVVERLPGGPYILDVLGLVVKIAEGVVPLSDVEWRRLEDMMVDLYPTLPIVRIPGHRPTP